MGSVREGCRFFDEIVDPRMELWIREIDVSRLHLSGDCACARELTTNRVDLDDSGYFGSKRSDNSRSVRLILDELRSSLRPLSAKALEHREHRKEVPTETKLIEEIAICAEAGPDLKDDI
jgi:hypothetical protein